jgi:hypothetical protein
MTLVKSKALRAMCAAVVLAGPVVAESAEEKRPYGSLVGSWVGASACTLVFMKDDGEQIQGNCDNDGVRHGFTGRYMSPNQLEITITRVDNKSGCTTTAEGFVRIASGNAIDVFQEGWNGCQVKTGPAATRLQRS